MPSILAIVSKAVFAKEAGRPTPGDVFATQIYRSNNRGLAPLAEGGDLYLATVRPGDVLWLVALLEAPSQTEEGWQAKANTRPITDITPLMSELRFSTGKGITAAPGKLGMSLQTPRTLTEGDVRLLAKALGQPAETKSSKREPAEQAKAKPAKAKPAKAKPAKAKPAKAKPAKAKPKAKPAAKKQAPTATAGSAEQTMRALLSAWEATKSADLAGLVDAYGRAKESDEARHLRERDKLPQDEWLAFARELGPLDRGALMPSLARAPAAKVSARLDLLEATWQPDPRLVDALHELIRALPWTSTGSRTVWTRTFRILATAGDPRTLAVADGFDPSMIASSWEGPGQWMDERLKKVAAKVRAQPAPAQLADEQQQLVEEVRAGLPREPSSNGGVSAADQLAYVLRNPDDDEARLVLADALQELGDPRGELITLQYQAKPTREQRKREKQILAKHHDRLLGPLAPIMMKRGLEFRRGFVHACELKENVHEPQLEKAATSELLATIRSARGPMAFVLLEKLRSLREVAITSSWRQSLESLLRHPTPLPFEELEIPLLEQHQVALLDGCACLPALKKLSLHTDEETIQQAMTTELVRGVEWLHVDHFDRLALGQLAERLLSPAGRGRTVSVAKEHTGYGAYRCEVRVTRPDKAYAVDVELSLPPPDWSGSLAQCLEMLGQTLESLRHLPTQVVVTSTKKLKEAESREALLQTLRDRVADPDALELRQP